MTKASMFGVLSKLYDNDLNVLRPVVFWILKIVPEFMLIFLT